MKFVFQIFFCRYFWSFTICSYTLRVSLNSVSLIKADNIVEHKHNKGVFNYLAPWYPNRKKLLELRKTIEECNKHERY